MTEKDRDTKIQKFDWKIRDAEALELLDQVPVLVRALEGVSDRLNSGDAKDQEDADRLLEFFLGIISAAHEADLLDDDE